MILKCVSELIPSRGLPSLQVDEELVQALMAAAELHKPLYDRYTRKTLKSIFQVLREVAVDEVETASA